VFDEGIKGWGPRAVKAGFRFLPLGQAGLSRLEELGWPLGPLSPRHITGMDGEMLAPSFSGWPLFTRASLPEELAYNICAALDAARNEIAWDYEGDVELRDLCGDSDAAPLGAPMHPGAAAYYKGRGAL
jgi:hypothetical protein